MLQPIFQTVLDDLKSMNYQMAMLVIQTKKEVNYLLKQKLG
jgi:hypothetical protein